jgi:DNA-binding response OmpR family regulator
VTINPGAREILVGGYPVSARAQEFDLLAVLAAHQGLVLSREQLLKLAWDYDYPGQTRTVDVHIAQLRRKLSDSNVKIDTVVGVGYKLVVE